MSKFMTFAAAVCLAAVGGAQAANLSVTYGWEDGTGTILGSFGNLVNDANVTTGDEISDSTTIYPGVMPYSGDHMLTVSESPHSSTPQAYLAYIENLAMGDTITASFYGWDSTPDASPSARIWGHWANNGDVNSYATSASGNLDYTAGTGWDPVSFTWTNDSGYEALVVEVRLYSSPSTADPALTSYFVDDLSVELTTSSPNAQITTPGGVTMVPEPTTLALGGFGLLSLLLLRRRN